MNILIIIKVKISVLIKWSYDPPPPPLIMWKSKPRMVIIFWARSPFSLKPITSVDVRTWSHTKPPKYRYPGMESNRIRVA